MKAIAIIPARRGSTRLSDKPLRDIAGMTLIERVWRQATKCTGLDEIFITTDDDEIENVSNSFGANVIRTSPEAPSGSARVAEAYISKYGALNKSSESSDVQKIVLNVQGDMPFVNPDAINLAISFFKENFSMFDMVTIAIPIYNLDEFERDSVVKVVVSDTGRGLYFSRAPIPYSREGDRIRSTEKETLNKEIYGYKHIGLYLFKEKTLSVFSENQDDTILEKIERLEQLKLLNLGYNIGVCIVPREFMEHSIEVDTELDLNGAIAYAKSMK